MSAYLNRMNPLTLERMKRHRLIKDNKIVGYYLVESVFENDPMLVDALAIPQELPNLLAWAAVSEGREGNYTPAVFMDLMLPYLANMVDDERSIVEPMLKHMSLFYRITGVDCHQDAVVIHTIVENENVSLVIAVLNMMDDE